MTPLIPATVMCFIISALFLKIRCVVKKEAEEGTKDGKSAAFLAGLISCVSFVIGFLLLAFLIGFYS